MALWTKHSSHKHRAMGSTEWEVSWNHTICSPCQSWDIGPFSPSPIKESKLYIQILLNRDKKFVDDDCFSEELCLAPPNWFFLQHLCRQIFLVTWVFNVKSNDAMSRWKRFLVSSLNFWNNRNKIQDGTNITTIHKLITIKVLTGQFHCDWWDI